MTITAAPWAPEVARVTGAPEFLQPWLDRSYDDADADLVLAAADDPLRAVPRGEQERAAPTADGPMSTVPHEASESGATEAAALSASTLERAWRRGILDREEACGADESADGDGSTASGEAAAFLDQRPAPRAPVFAYRPAGFRTRFEHWALFEGWKDVPGDVRARLCEWEAAHYTDGLRDRVATLRAGDTPPEDERGAAYVLLDEAEALLRRAERIYLWPCDCRAMVGGCGKPQMVCLRFENDRGVGWEISTERAVELMRAANRAGLMQTAEIVPGDGPISDGAICNCCADCCFEQRASRALDAARIWPHSRYVAEVPDDCSRCGLCARRCPFEAITMTGAARDDGKHLPVLDPGLCRGCGVCATGCPDEVIAMRPPREDVTAPRR